jgi:hypothetical protein
LYSPTEERTRKKRKERHRKNERGGREWEEWGGGERLVYDLGEQG